MGEGIGEDREMCASLEVAGEWLRGEDTGSLCASDRCEGAMNASMLSERREAVGWSTHSL